MLAENVTQLLAISLVIFGHGALVGVAPASRTVGLRFFEKYHRLRPTDTTQVPVDCRQPSAHTILTHSELLFVVAIVER